MAHSVVTYVVCMYTKKLSSETTVKDLAINHSATRRRLAACRLSTLSMGEGPKKNPSTHEILNSERELIYKLHSMHIPIYDANYYCVCIVLTKMNGHYKCE